MFLVHYSYYDNLLYNNSLTYSGMSIYRVCQKQYPLQNLLLFSKNNLKVSRKILHTSYSIVYVLSFVFLYTITDKIMLL